MEMIRLMIHFEKTWTIDYNYTNWHFWNSDTLFFLYRRVFVKKKKKRLIFLIKNKKIWIYIYIFFFFMYAKINLKKKPYHCIKTLKIGIFLYFEVYFCRIIAVSWYTLNNCQKIPTQKKKKKKRYSKRKNRKFLYIHTRCCIHTNCCISTVAIYTNCYNRQKNSTVNFWQCY